jgi:SAM-dependent methyltransferase
VSPFYDRYPIHAPKSAPYRVLRRLVMSPVYFRTTGLARGSVLLDYGCGDGSFLEEQAGTGIERVGYEPDPDHAAALTDRLGVPVYADAELLLRDLRGGVDALTMHFVLEHLTDLEGTFAQVSQLLRPGGVFYFVVPHASSFEARLFGRRWHNLDPPRHISFPEHQNVTALAAASGMRLLSEWPVAFPNGFAGSLPVVLSGRFRFPLFALSLPLGIAFSRLCPTGTRAYLLRKPLDP